MDLGDRGRVSTSTFCASTTCIYTIGGVLAPLAVDFRIFARMGNNFATATAERVRHADAPALDSDDLFAGLSNFGDLVCRRALVHPFCR